MKLVKLRFLVELCHCFCLLVSCYIAYSHTENPSLKFNSNHMSHQPSAVDLVLSLWISMENCVVLSLSSRHSLTRNSVKTWFHWLVFSYVYFQTCCCWITAGDIPLHGITRIHEIIDRFWSPRVFLAYYKPLSISRRFLALINAFLRLRRIKAYDRKKLFILNERCSHWHYITFFRITT